MAQERTHRRSRVHVAINVFAATALMATLAAGVIGTGPNVSAQTADDPAIPGEALAAADTIGLMMKTGGLAIGINLGRSVAGYTEGQATARADALDLGALTTLFGEASTCAGAVPILGKTVLPPKTIADSQDAGSEVSRRVEAYLPDGAGGLTNRSAGFQDATATGQPSSVALTDTPPQDLSFFQLVDAHTLVSTSRVNGVREAKAAMWADKLTIMGGLVVLRQPRWEAVARSGAAQGNVGSFTFSGATILGVNRTFDQASADVQNFAKSLHDMLSNLGIYLDYPTVTQIEGGVKVSPMQFRITDMPLGITSLGPFIAQLQPLREKLFEDLKKQNCANNNGLQLLDLVLQLLSGSGNVLIPVGGVEASTKPTVFPAAVLTPVGSGAATPPPTFAAPVDTTPVEVADTDTARTFTTPTSGFEEPTAVIPEETIPPDTEVVPTTIEKAKPKKATTTEVAAPAVAKGKEPTSKSTTVALGIMALVGALGLMVGDQIVMRRSRRRIIQ